MTAGGPCVSRNLLARIPFLIVLVWWWFGQPVERLVLRIDFLATLWSARIQEQSLLQAAVAFPSGGRPCACLVARGCLFIVRVSLPGL